MNRSASAIGSLPQGSRLGPDNIGRCTVADCYSRGLLEQPVVDGPGVGNNGVVSLFFCCQNIHQQDWTTSAGCFASRE